MNTSHSLLIFAALATHTLGACSSAEQESFDKTASSLSSLVGESCTLDDENLTDFRGFDAGEINYSKEGHSCEIGGCMVYGFQGRLSCPEGQEEGEGGCLTPDGEPVTVPVAPQLESAPPESSVFCSCRCDGPDTGEPFCACPNNFTCEPTFHDLGLGDEYTGSYCVPEGASERWEPASGEDVTQVEEAPSRPVTGEVAGAGSLPSPPVTGEVAGAGSLPSPPVTGEVAGAGPLPSGPVTGEVAGAGPF